MVGVVGVVGVVRAGAVQGGLPVEVVGGAAVVAVVVILLGVGVVPVSELIEAGVGETGASVVVGVPKGQGAQASSGGTVGAGNGSPGTHGTVDADLVAGLLEGRGQFLDELEVVGGGAPAAGAGFDVEPKVTVEVGRLDAVDLGDDIGRSVAGALVAGENVHVEVGEASAFGVFEVLLEVVVQANAADEGLDDAPLESVVGETLEGGLRDGALVVADVEALVALAGVLGKGGGKEQDEDESGDFH